MIVAIDSGGTKTKIILAEENGEIVKTKIIKGFGSSTDAPDIPIPELIGALKEMCGPECPVSRVAVNLGGKNTTQFHNCIRSVFKNSRIDIFRESSGVIGDMIREKYSADIIFFCGTGCIVIAKSEDKYMVFDGWGKDIGDFGSGYYIGLKAVKNSLTELEEQKPLSMLAKRITGEESPFVPSDSFVDLMEKRDSVRTRIMPVERAKIASYSKTVFECAGNGDTASLNIFTDVGERLADTAKRAIDIFKNKSYFKIAFCGGVCVSKDYWLDSFNLSMQKDNVEVETVFPDFDFALGALEYAIKRR